MPGNGKYPRLHTTRNVISGITVLWDRMRKLHWMIKPKLHASWHYDKCCVKSDSADLHQISPNSAIFVARRLGINLWKFVDGDPYTNHYLVFLECVMCHLLVLKQVLHNESQVWLVCMCQSSPHQQTTCGYACCQGTNIRFHNTFIDEDNMSLLKRGMAAHGVISGWSLG